MPERHIENRASSGHLDVRSDDRLATTDRGPHRFAKHRVDASTRPMAKTNFVVTPGAGAEDRRLSWSRLSASWPRL